MGVSRRNIGIVVGLLVVSLSLGGAGLATAGDIPAFLEFESEEFEATAGETVTVDVLLHSQGGHRGEGVEYVAFTVAYDSSLLSVEDVERGPWLEDDDTSVSMDTDVEDDGQLSVVQEREPPAGGTTGSGTVATITFAVDDDADDAEAALTLTDVTVTVTSDFQQPTITEESVIHVSADSDSTLEPSMPGFSPATALAALLATILTATVLGSRVRAN